MTYLLQVSTCWILFFAIYLLFLQKETFFSVNRYYLLGALLLGLGIPYFGGLLPANHTSTEIYHVMNLVTEVEVTTLVEHEQSPLTLYNFLYFIYYSGATIVFVRFMYGLSSIYNIYKSAQKTSYDNYTLVESSKYHLPFSFFRYIFISAKLPLNKNVEKVLKHEELHVNQWHSLDIVFLELLQVFFWFNPVLIFYKKALKQSHEFLADAYVIEDHNKSSYGQLLLRQSTSGLEIALANHFFHSQIKKRITMMYKEKSKRPAMVKYLAAIPVLIALLVLFASSKSNDHNQSINQDCLEIKLDDDGVYTHNDRQIMLFDIETMLAKDTKIDCINLMVSSRSKISSATKILDASSKYKIPVYLDVAKNSKSLESSLEERKIVQEKVTPSIKTTGKVAVLVEANKKGDVVYAEILKDESSITEKESLVKILKAVKQYKFEPANNNSIGKLRFEFENLTTDTDLIIENNDMVHSKQDMQHNDQTPLFRVVEEMPRFPGCEEGNQTAKEKENCGRQEMLNFIYENLTYPKAAKDAGIEGMCVVQFVVEKDGSITGGKIIRNIGGGCGEESLDVVNSMPIWIPGKQNGKAVRVLYTLPVKFKLEPSEPVDNQVKFIISDELKTTDSYEIGLGTDVPEGTVKVSKGEIQLTEGRDYKIDYASGKLSIINKTYLQENTPITVTFEDKLDKTKREKLQDSSSKEEVFRVVEEMPRFPGCENEELTLSEKDKCSKQKMLEFIYKNIKYPADARNQGVEGTAVVQLVIEKDGSVSSSKILRNPGAGTGEEAQRVIDSMPTWIPGKQKGKLVRVQYVLPIKYKLDIDNGNVKSETAKNNTPENLINSGFELFQNVPNPFREETTIGFNLPEAAPATLTVYDVSGKVIYNRKIDGVRGYNTINLTTTQLGTQGIVYYTLKSGEFTTTRKMIIT